MTLFFFTVSTKERLQFACHRNNIFNLSLSLFQQQHLVGYESTKLQYLFFVVVYEHVYVCPTSQNAVCYGLSVFSQQVSLGYSSQGEITGHVPAQLPVASLQEPHRYRDGQHHDRWTTVVLGGHKE